MTVRTTVAALVAMSMPAFPAFAVEAPATSNGPGDDSRLVQSREITARFARQLKSELEAALTTGGPVAAIDVCKDAAPRIASELSRQTGARVGRTSLRFRNSLNAPDRWQIEVLERFDAAAANGDKAAMEYFGREEDTQRYMKAIPTGGVCLACHGTRLNDDVRAVLDMHYPFDRARGYQLGDIRGAFSVVWFDD